MVKKKNANLSTYLSEIAVQGIQEKKGNDIVRLDLRELNSSVSDYFVQPYSSCRCPDHVRFGGFSRHFVPVCRGQSWPAGVPCTSPIQPSACMVCFLIGFGSPEDQVSPPGSSSIHQLSPDPCSDLSGGFPLEAFNSPFLLLIHLVYVSCILSPFKKL